MNGPVISIDVSNGKSHFQAFESKGKKRGKVHLIYHNVEGFNFLLNSINEFKAYCGKEVAIVYEATGVYTRPLRRFLTENNIKFYEISPLLSAKVRKTDIRAVKTDKIDPKSIADVYYDKDIREFVSENDIYAQLKALNRYYEDIMEHFRKYKVTFKQYLSIVFPGYDKLFKDEYSQDSLLILKKYPHPDMIKNKKAETVAKKLDKAGFHHYETYVNIANKVIEHANSTYPGCEKDDLEVKFLLELIDLVEETQTKLKETLDQMIELAKQLPNYEIIKSIDGIGENLATRILAEIGDISRFESREALIAYAGTDPRISESGDQKSDHLSITKKGNKRLRCLLYLAVGCNLSTGKSNPISDFYHKKMQQSNGLTWKAARVAAMNKLLRTIYGMCKNQTTFNR